MAYVVNSFVVFASIVVLYFAYFKKSELGKLSIYVIFASILLQQLFGIMLDWSIFNFINEALGFLVDFVRYAEVILLIILLLMNLQKCKKELRIAVIVLIVIKTVALIF